MRETVGSCQQRESRCLLVLIVEWRMHVVQLGFLRKVKLVYIMSDFTMSNIRYW
jgi:hypothetical protein